MTYSHLRRGGTYYRVCDPGWVDPSDTSYSKAKGGRWNPPDRPGRPGFGALYLNATVIVARENARRHVKASFGTATDDFADDAHLPDLQHYDVVEADFVDAVTPAAVAAMGLPSTYPSVPHPPCQGIGEDAYAQGEHGIVPLSATSIRATGADEELVIFDRDVVALARKTTRAKFATWY